MIELWIDPGSTYLRSLSAGLVALVAVLSAARTTRKRPTAAGWLLGPSIAVGWALAELCALRTCDPSWKLCFYLPKLLTVSFGLEASLAASALVLAVAAARDGAQRPIVAPSSAAAAGFAAAVAGLRAMMMAWALRSPMEGARDVARVGLVAGIAALVAAVVAARRSPTALILLAGLWVGAMYATFGQLLPEMRYELAAHGSP